jgi:hypothetical protein
MAMKIYDVSLIIFSIIFSLLSLFIAIFFPINTIPRQFECRNKIESMKYDNCSHVCDKEYENIPSNCAKAISDFNISLIFIIIFTIIFFSFPAFIFTLLIVNCIRKYKNRKNYVEIGKENC